MYESHPNLVEPPPHAMLWRYMDVTKLLAMLETQTLHMAALASFADPFEGHPPRSVVSAFTARPVDLSEEERPKKLADIENNLQSFQSVRHLVYASCWHINEGESAGMWSQYIRSGEGIAIQTSFEHLKEAISEQPHNVSGALVQYVDFETFEPKDMNVLVWAALKRKDFEHEREFRLLVLGGRKPAGIQIPVNCHRLIEHIYVAPTTPDWILSLITSILRRYGYDLTPIRSQLAESPKYYVVPEWAKGS